MPAEKAFLNNLTDAVDEVDLWGARTVSRAGPRAAVAAARGLNRAETTALLASFRTDRDRAIARAALSPLSAWPSPMWTSPAAGSR